MGRRWLLVGGAWTLVAAFSVGQIYLAQAALGHAPPLGPLLVLELPVWTFWAMVTVPVVMLSRRHPLERHGSGLALPLHVGAGIGVALVAVAFHTVWYQAFNPYPLMAPSVESWFWQYFRRHFVISMMIYWAVVEVWHAIRNHARYLESESEIARARAQLSEARLQTLRTQLRPHFLFNTLNSVSALLADDPARARRVLAELGELLRASLRSDAHHEITLEEEVGFLSRYLELERIRYGARLGVEMRIDRSTRRAAVPTFLFQPLVENAVRHGVAARPGGGRLWFTAERDNGSLVVRVMDDGPGIAGGPPPEGIGLANTRRRLDELYGRDQTLALEPRPGGGLTVRVELPFRQLSVAW